jgi:hypothetical protein
MTGKVFASTEDMAAKKVAFEQIGQGFMPKPPRAIRIPASSSATTASW